MAGANEESLTRQLGKHIRSRRRQLGLTQEQLAEMIGVGHQALSRIEQGKMAPKMDRLPSLAKACNALLPTCSGSKTVKTALPVRFLKMR